MALEKCPECGKEISSNAESCPHCGAPTLNAKSAAASSSAARVILMVMAVMSVIPAIMFAGGLGLIIPAILFILALILK